MIADLRGQTALLVAVQPPLDQALEAAFVRHGAAVVPATVAEFAITLERCRNEGRTVAALVFGNPATTTTIADLAAYDAEGLTRAISEGAWPVFAALQRAKSLLGSHPRYVIALSSITPDRFAPGADFSAASEAVLETLCRFANERLSTEDVRMNILRHRLAPPERAGQEGHFFATPEEVANAAVALCSGLLDSMRGEVLTVDRGASFSDNVFRRFEERAALGN